MINATPVIFLSDIYNQKKHNKILFLLEKFGYLHILDVGSVIPDFLFKNLKSVSKQLFSIPIERKMDFYIGNSKGHRGYVPISEKGSYGDEKNRVYEAYDIGFNFKKEYNDWFLYGKNKYPEEIKEIEETINIYFKSCLKIGKDLSRIFLKNYSDLDIEKNIDHPASQLRLIHYLENTMQDNKDFPSMGAHTDYEMFTLLYQNSPGLLAFNRENKKWEQLPIYKNSLTLICGDMLDTISGRKIKSLLHRVSTSGEERYSFPFFMNLNHDTVIRDKNGSKIIVGEHLISQLTRDFPSLKNKINKKYNSDFEVQF